MADNNFQAALELFVDLDEKELVQFKEMLDEMDISFRKVEASAARLKEGTEQLGKTAQKGFAKTSLASQEMIRIIQDAPFGLFGVTNNIQALFDQLANQARKTGQSMSAVFAQSFRGMITGPMSFAALAAVITTVIFSWDQLKRKVDEFAVQLGLLSDKQLTYNELLKEQKKLQKEISGGKFFIEAIQAIDSVEDAEDFLEREKIRKENIQQQKENLKALRPLIRQGQLIAEHNIPILTKEQQKSFDTFSEFGTVEFLDDTVASTQKRLLEAQNNILAAQTRIEELRAERRAEFLIGATVSPDGKSKKEKEVKDLTLDISQAQVEAMEEGLIKIIAQIKLNAAREIEAIEGSAEQRKELTKAIRIREQAEIAQAVKEAHEKDMKAIRAQQKDVQTFIKKQHQEMQTFIRAIQQRDNASAQAGFFGGLMVGSSPEARRNNLLAQNEFNNALIDNELKRLAAERDIGDKTIAQKQAINARIAALEAQRKYNTEQTNKAIIDSDRQQLASRIQLYSGMATHLGNAFGNIATVLATAGKRGLEENKSFLKAQAVMQAIAASASITAQILAFPDGTPPFLKIGTAFAAGASILSQLMATIRRIDSAGSNASVSTFQSGFTALNPTISAERVRNLATARDRREQAAIDRMGDNISSQRIVYDDGTAADIVNRGNRRLSHVGGGNGRSFR